MTFLNYDEYVLESMLNEELSALQQAYRDYFNFMLSKYGVKSPSKLSAEEKTKFFKDISKNWIKGVGASDTIKTEMEDKNN